MKIIGVLLCAIIGSTIAKPEGYYQQEYQFKKSSSSYQNNELQSKNEDEGFYSKHGDLEGNAAPKVNQHSEHREFVNPKLSGNGGHTVTTYNNRDLTEEAERVFRQHNFGMHGSRGMGGIQSYGASEGNSYGASEGHSLGTADGSFGAGDITTGGQAGKSHSYSSYSSYSKSSSHSLPHTYQVQSNLAPLTQNVENELSQQLQNAIITFQKQSAYRSHALTSDDFKILEDELKANLTRQLNEALRKKYGQQGKYGEVSYTVTTTGVRSPQANYDNQELVDLSKRLEDNLLKQLHEGIRTVHTQTTTQHRTTGTRYINSDATSGNRYYNRDSAEVEDLNRHDAVHTISDHRTNTYQGADVGTQTRRPVIRYTIRPTYVDGNDDNVQSTEKITYASIASGNPRQQPSKTQYTQLHVETEQSGIRTDSYSPGQVYQRPYTPVTYEQNYPKPSPHSTDRERVTGYSHTSTYQENFPTIQTERITVNPSIRLVDVAQNVQNDLSTQLNSALRTYEEQYTNSDYQLTHSRPDFQRALENFKQDLKSNITRLLQEEVRKHYGTQVQRGEYSFSSGSRTVANYRVEDLENLRQQIENNLIGHLENSIKQQENRYSSRITQTSTYYTSSARGHQGYNPSSYDGGSYTHYKPATNTHTSQVSYTASSSSRAPNELQDITHQVQEDLSEQLREAVRRQSSTGYTSSSYTSQSNQQMVDDLTEELRRNLTKSLEESLQKHYGQQGVKGGYSYTVSTSGVYSPKANYNKQDLNALMQQMQADLERQLREQMQSSYTQSHYSSSMISGSSNYRPSRYTSQATSYYPSSSQSGAFQKYSQFERYGSCGDCMQGDAPSGNGQHPRNRRSLRLYQQNEDDLGQQVEDLDQLQQEEAEELHQHPQSPRGGYRNVVWRGAPVQEVEQFQSPHGGYRNVVWRGTPVQEIEQFQSPRDRYRNVVWRGTPVQETEHLQSGGYRNVVWRSSQGQKIEDLSQISQQSEDTQHYLSNSAKNQHRQEVENFQRQLNRMQPNVGQQEVDDYDYENLEVGNSGKQKQVQGQQIEQFGPQQETDVFQQTENEDFGQLQIGNSHHVGQQTEEFEQGQKVEQIYENSPPKMYDSHQHTGIGKAKLEDESPQQQKDLTQQTEDMEQQIEDLGQQTEEFYLGQQIEDSGLSSGKSNKKQEIEDWHLGQQTEQDTQLGQETEELHHGQQRGKLHVGQETENFHLRQEADNSYLGQETEDFHSGQETENFHLGQQADDSYLGQETENFHLGQETENFHSGQETENFYLGQQADNSYLGQQTENFHLGQETENFHSGQETENFHLGQETENVHLGQEADNSYLGQETEDFQQNEGKYLGQETEDFHLGQHDEDFQTAKQSDDFHLGQETVGQRVGNTNSGKATAQLEQQSEDFHLGQETEDLHLGQETEDFAQSDLTQQTEDDYYTAEPGYNRHSYNSAYRQPDRAVPVDELTQQLPHDFLGNPQLNRGNTMSDNKEITHLDHSGGIICKPRPLYPSNSLNYGTQQREDEDLTQNLESFEDLHQIPTYTDADHYRTAHVSSYNHHRSYSQRPMETQQVEDFGQEEEEIKPKIYYPLASAKNEDSYVRLSDVLQSSPQGRSLPHSPSDSHSGQSQNADVQEVLAETGTQPAVEETATEEPGFWKKLGGKIKTTYNSAKQKAKNIVDKISNSGSST